MAGRRGYDYRDDHFGNDVGDDELLGDQASDTDEEYEEEFEEELEGECFEVVVSFRAFGAGGWGFQENVCDLRAWCCCGWLGKFYDELMGKCV